MTTKVEPDRRLMVGWINFYTYWSSTIALFRCLRHGNCFGVDKLPVGIRQLPMKYKQPAVCGLELTHLDNRTPLYASW